MQRIKRLAKQNNVNISNTFKFIEILNCNIMYLKFT